MSTPISPISPPLCPTAIPTSLQRLHQWICWRYETRAGGAKPTKVPYRADGRGKAKSNDPSTWTDFATAVEASPRYSGIGLCLADGDGLCGIDLDGCLDDALTPTPAAMEVLRRFSHSYAEISPSGKGLRIFCLGSPTRSGKGGGANKWIEVYDHLSPRYLTVTGARFGEAIEPKPAQDALDWLHETYMEPAEAPPKPKSPRAATAHAPLSLDDDAVLRRAMSAANGADFRRLYGGDHGGDHSSADLALCNMLAFWCAKDAAQMDRLFRASGLMRPKWDEKRGQRGTYGEITIQRAISDCAEVYSAPAPSESREPSAPTESWRTHLRVRYSKEGEATILATVANATLILASVCGESLAYDEFHADVVFLAPPPWNQWAGSPLDIGTTATHTPLLDVDYHRARIWLERKWAVTLGKDAIYDAMFVAANRNRFHPLRQWMDALTWDRIPRLDHWLAQFLGATDAPEYLAMVGAKWMISAVARVYRPGCKADHVLILEGAQGSGKSSALACLATVGGRCYAADTPIILGRTDAYLFLRGAWIVELAELDSLIRAENSEAKAFFTSGVDRYRPPYLRAVQDFPRQCVFAGSVNESEYLRDSTGGRRYWPVSTGRIDLHVLALHRDQIWAEAVARYKKGEAWHPTTEAQRVLCRAQQAERQIEDPWTPLVAMYLGDSTANRLTGADILKGALGLDADRHDRRAQMRLAAIMQNMPTWRKDRFICSGVRVSGYARD